MSNLITKQVVVYPNRQGAVFQAGDEINFYLPPSIGLLNPDSYLRFNLKMKGNLKKFPCKSAGAASIISSIVLSSGDGRTIYETLDNYAIKAALYYHFSQNEGSKQLRYLHEGQPNKTALDGHEFDTGKSANQYIDADATDKNLAFRNVEVLLPLWCSGILSPLRQKVFPLLATQGLRIRIQLNSVKDATQVLSAPIYNGAAGASNAPPTLNAYGKQGGGYTTKFSGATNGGGTEIALDRPREQVGADYANEDVARIGGVANCGHPFLVGQTITVDNDDGSSTVTRTITGIAQDGDNKVVLTVAAMGGAHSGITSARVAIDTSDSANPDEGYEVQNLQMVCGVTVPDQQYISMVQKGVAQGKFQIDIHTYTDYPINITANSKQNALYIKSINSRAKSIMAVPIKTDAVEDFVEDTWIPDIQNLDNYQFYLYGTLTPNRPVSMKEFQQLDANGNKDLSEGSFSGVGLREMEHAFAASGYNVNNLLYAWTHPFVGRRLANPGYSMALNREGDVRLNMNFDSKSGPAASLVHCFVSHIRRITISGNNQEVML